METKIEVGTKFMMHTSMKYRDEGGSKYHEFDSECVVTEIDKWNAEYKVVRQFNEANKPSWQTAEITTQKGGFALRFHKIVDGKLVSKDEEQSRGNQVAGERKAPTKKSARLLSFKKTEQFAPVKIIWKHEGDSGPCWWASASGETRPIQPPNHKEGAPQPWFPLAHVKAQGKKLGLLVETI